MNIPSSNYFKSEHEKSGHFITWAEAVDRGKGCISVVYKVLGDNKQHRAPRWKAIWLDANGLDHAKLVVLGWKKANNNSSGKGKLLPQFYLSHRRAFVKWLANTCRPTTISGYEASLEQYIFPYFVERLALTSPKNWNQEAVSKWDASLSTHLNESGSRNRKRTALSRYLRFLKQKNEIQTIPQIIFESSRRKTKETLIPGDLPSWSDALAWLKTLPPGRFRFIRAVTISFGLRISEAFAVKEEDFIGASHKDDLLVRNDFVSNLVSKGIGALFLEVTKAKKKNISSDLLKLLGGEDNQEPKSGPYTACCINKDLAEFVISLIENGEHREELTSEKVYKIIKELPADQSNYKFNLYNPHDDRRLNITLQCLDMSTDINDFVEICCQLHGQASRDVFARYFQWGQMQRRINRKTSNAILSVLKVK